MSARRGTPQAVAVALLALAALALGGHPPAGAEEPGDRASLFLPALLRRARVEGMATARALPTERPATATATATEAPTDTPAPTRTPGPSPTPRPPACTRPLEERLVVTNVTTDAEVRSGSTGSWTRVPLHMAARSDGTALVAWSGGDGVHVTPLDADLRRSGPDLVVPGDTPSGLVAHDDGGAALVVARPDDLHLVRLDADGATLFETQLVGMRPHGETGAKWIDDWGYEGRLTWTGTAYAVYTGHTQFFGANGKHQGDLLWLFDERGERIAADEAGSYPMWDWGCSHSLDVRLSYNASTDLVGPMCLSDAYPGKGFFFRHTTRVGQPVWANGSGRANGHLGGIVPLDGGFAVTYSTEAERRSYDVALTIIDEFGFTANDLWLTDTPSVNETGPHLARYGNGLFAAWEAGSRLLGEVVRPDGTVVAGPAALATGLDAQDDMVNLAGGDVAWAAKGTGRSLRLARLAYCEADGT